MENNGLTREGLIWNVFSMLVEEHKANGTNESVESIFYKACNIVSAGIRLDTIIIS